MAFVGLFISFKTSPTVSHSIQSDNILSWYLVTKMYSYSYGSNSANVLHGFGKS